MFDAIVGFFNKALGSILFFLPNSPFTDVIEELGKLEFLSYLNWLVPIGRLVGIGVVWLSCVGVYYTCQVILRWVKAVG